MSRLAVRAAKVSKYWPENAPWNLQDILSSIVV